MFFPQTPNFSDIPLPEYPRPQLVRNSYICLNGDWDYIINRKDKTVELTDSGARKAERFFRIDNIAEIEHADLNHHIQQALKAHKLFKLDEDYIVQDGDVIFFKFNV